MSGPVVFVSTSNYAFEFFLADYITQVSKAEDVLLICNADHGLPATDTRIASRIVPFRRQPHPLFDAVHLLRLYRLLRATSPKAMFSISPKAGLLAAVAGWAARVPVRVHFFTGQVWVTRTGVWRTILKTLDKAIARCATHVLIDSPSQRDFLIDQGIVPAHKARVLGLGSVAGVDTRRFAPDAAARSEIRAALGIPTQAPVLLFLGRITHDKGVADLQAAFRALAPTHPDAHLIYVGPDEGAEADLKRDAPPNVHFAGMTRTPERYLAAADIFCLPSYREGFGLAVLEAASTGLPAVGSDIYGVSDAIDDGKTGLLHRVRDADDIAAKLKVLLNNPDLRKEMAQAARNRAHDKFGKQAMLQFFDAFFKKAMTRSGKGS